MPVVFGPTLRRLAGTDEESDAESDEPDPPRRASAPEKASEQASAASGGPVTPRRLVLGALVAGAVAWLATRRPRRPDIEPPF